jgi:hypothetical protein
MSFVRPEVQALFTRWRGVLGAGALALAGVWVFARGGWLMGAVGAVLALAGLGLGWLALQRLRFARPATGPGVVEVIEGQIGWYGPGIGGYVSLSDLTQLGLVTVAGLRCWRLVQADGQLLQVPVDATGAEKLFDALTALPGIEPRRLLTALDLPADSPFLWRRDLPKALPRP